MTARDALHRLIDELSEHDVEVASRILGGLKATGDPVLRVLITAPAGPGLESSEFQAEAHRQSLAVATSPHAEEDQAFIEAISEHFVPPPIVQRLPPTDRGRNRS